MRKKLSAVAILILACAVFGAPAVDWNPAVDLLSGSFDGWMEADNDIVGEAKRYSAQTKTGAEFQVEVNNPDGRRRGVRTADISLNQSVAQPLKFSGELYLDSDARFGKDAMPAFCLVTVFQDGSVAYNIMPGLEAGERGRWVSREYELNPPQPIKTVWFYLLNYNVTGTLRCRNVRLATVRDDAAGMVRDVAGLHHAGADLTLGDYGTGVALTALRPENLPDDVTIAGGKANLWNARLRNLNTNRNVYIAGGGDISLQTAPGKLVIRYDRIPLPDCPDALQVELTVTAVPGKAMFDFDFAGYLRDDAPYAWVDINYPVLDHISYTRAGAPENTVFYPQDTGMTVPASTFGSRELTYGTWYMSMQYLFLYGDGGGLYLQCSDSRMYRKSLQIERNINDGTFQLAVVHYPENTGTAKEYVAPYPVQLGFLGGDWFDAAGYYRQWALQQPWSQVPLLEQNDSTAPFFHEPVLMLTHGSAAGKTYSPEYASYGIEDFNALPPEKLADLMHVDADVQVADLAQSREYFGVPLLGYMGNFVQPFGVSHPFGVTTITGLIEAMRRLKPLDIYYIPWLSARLFDRQSLRFDTDNAVDSIVIDSASNGVYASSSSVMCGAMDMAAEYWPRALTEATGRLMREGYGGIYYDELASTGGEMCFSTRHGHPVGGGCYPMAARRAFLRNLRETFRPEYPYFFTMGEELSEGYVGLCDLNWLYGSRRFDNVPAFQTVYHERAFLNGVMAEKLYDPWLAHNRYADPTGATDSEIARAFVARNLVAGMGLGVVRGDLRQYAPEFAAWLRDILAVYRAGKEYLLYGRLLREPEIAPAAEFHALWDNQEMVTLPVVIGSNWLHDGKIALVLVNLSSQEQLCSVTPEWGELAGRPVAGKDLQSGQIHFSIAADATPFTVLMPALAARVIEFAPATGTEAVIPETLPEFTVHLDHDLYGKSSGETGMATADCRNASMREVSVSFSCDDGRTQTAVIAPQTRQLLRLPVTLGPANRIQSFTVRLEGPEREYVQEFKLTPREAAEKFAIRQYRADYVEPGRIAIDGELGDWPDTLETITDLTCYDRQNIRQAAAPEAEAAFAWSEAGLYGRWRVRKAALVEPPDEPERIWFGDLIQVAFHVFMADQDRYTLIQLGLTRIDGRPRVVSWSGKQYAQAVELAVRRDGESTVYEAFFPQSIFWNGLGEGSRLRGSFSINDNDGAGFAGYRAWTPGVMFGENPAAFAEIICE